MRDKNHIYFVFRIILDTFGIIMQNENHIYYVLRIILDTYGNIMKIITYILCFSDYFRPVWKYNLNKNHINCVFRIVLDTYGIIMRIKIMYIVIFGLFWTLLEL